MPGAGADKSAMPVTWVFGRGGEQLQLERQDDRRGAALTVSSAEGRRRFAFRDQAALGKFQTDMEQFLVRTGWSLVSISPERRNYTDRRRFPRITNDRRRWWTDATESLKR
jgi:hypothetical protein